MLFSQSMHLRRDWHAYKTQTLESEVPGHFGELSEMILNRINDSCRDSYVDFMLENPIIAKRKNINIR